MRRRLTLPPHGSAPKNKNNLYSRPVGSCSEAWRQFTLNPDHLHPVVHIAHRLIANVSLRYREIYDFEFLAILEGKGDFHIGNDVYKYQPGTLLFIPPSTPHTLISRSGPKGDHLAVHFDLSPQCPGKKRPGNYRVQIKDIDDIGPVLTWDDTTIALLADTIIQFKAADPLGRLRASHNLQKIFLHLFTHQRKVSADTHSDEAILAALACIDEHFHETLSVEDLAAAAGLQRSRFAQRFKTWCGRPPMAFLRRYRIDRAAELIDLDSERTLESIAEHCGFADAFTLSKAFKAELGLSPKAYRQRKIGV